MSTRRRVVLENAPLPSPFPEGWYFVTSRQALVEAGMIEKDVDGGEHRRLERRERERVRRRGLLPASGCRSGADRRGTYL